MSFKLGRGGTLWYDLPSGKGWSKKTAACNGTVGEGRGGPKRNAQKQHSSTIVHCVNHLKKKKVSSSIFILFLISNNV